MLKFNSFIYYLGMILTGVGMITGLPLIMLEDPLLKEVGKYLVTMITPFGFLLWFTGFTAYTLIRPNIREGEEENVTSHEHRNRVPD